MNYNAQEAN